MAETTGARRATSGINHTITVSVNGTPNPLTTNADIDDTITFVVSPGPGCYLWTWDNSELANVFENQSNNNEPLAYPKPNGPYSFNPSVVSPGDTVTFQTNANPPSASEEARGGPEIGVKGTIQISSTMGDHKTKR
jgi:hypothetical protein